MQFLLRLLGIRDATAAERRATFWTGAMFFCALASTFVLRPLRSQFGVDQGVDRLPHLYSITLAVTVVFTPLFWWLANRMPSRRFVPIALHAFAAAMAVLFFGLQTIGDYDWKAPGGRQLGEGFWAFFSAFNVAVPTLVWIHVVEHFRRDQAVRLFGLISVGGTLGAVFGSMASGWLSASGLPPSAAAIASMLLLEATFLCYRRSQRACALLPVAGAAPQRIAGGGMFVGLRLLVRSPYLLGIAAYMMLLGVLATAFDVTQTELVGAQVANARGQNIWLASVETWVQTVAVLLQLFATGHLLRSLPAALFLCLLPVLATLGLGALWLWPTVLAVGIVQIVRRGSQFSLEKPAREVLYTPLGLEQKHKVKFLLDTVAFRLGDLLGALFQCELRDLRLSAGSIALCTVGLAAVWAAIGFGLARRRQAPAPSA